MGLYEAAGEVYVYGTTNGKYYHTNSTCSGMKNAKRYTLKSMLSQKRKACPVCASASDTVVYASEGGNFGSFTTFNMAKKLNAKMYAEAERLGCKWILGGECGHMWRVINQYMDTYNGPTPAHMQTPVSPITGTVFEHAASTKMLHIAEFEADLIKHGKLNLDPSRNDDLVCTWHDSCNPARAMGLLDEPRYVLKHVVNKFYEMPENTIRENTFCCGAGSGCTGAGAGCTGTGSGCTGAGADAGTGCGAGAVYTGSVYAGSCSGSGSCVRSYTETACAASCSG